MNADDTGEINLTLTPESEQAQLRERARRSKWPDSRDLCAVSEITPFEESLKDNDSENQVWAMNLDDTSKTRLAAGMQPSWALGFVPKSKTP